MTVELLHLALKQECSRMIPLFFAASKIVVFESQENDLPFFNLIKKVIICN